MPRTYRNNTYNAAQPGAPKTAQLGHGARFASLFAGAAIAAIAVVYLLGCVHYYDRFWPNTKVGDADLSNMTETDAIATLDQASRDRTVSVSGQGVSFTLTGGSAGLEIDSAKAVQAALADNACWQWPVQIFAHHDETDVVTSSFNTDLLRGAIESSLEVFNASATDPINAALYFDESTNRFEINPGSLGTKLDVDSVMDTVKAALVQRSPYAALTSANLVQQSVKADDATLVSMRDTANAYLNCSLDLTLNGTVVASVTPSLVKDWIDFGDDGTVSLDDGQLTAWVDGVEAIVDSVGSTRSYTRPNDGQTFTVSGGNYGWISDGAALEDMVRNAVYNAQVGSADIPTKQTASTFNPCGADWSGSNWIDVDLGEQHVRYFDAWGNVLWESDCVSGAYGTHDTPTGVYYIYNKALDQTLLGNIDPETGKREYETPVQYWIPFNDGVGLHDANWQPDFGGSMYMNGYGSHGCVNLPPSAAAELYSLCSIGDAVIVHY